MEGGLRQPVGEVEMRRAGSMLVVVCLMATALPAHADSHVAADEKRESAEHLLLRYARLTAHEPADAGSELLVVGHGAIVPRRPR